MLAARVVNTIANVAEFLGLVRIQFWAYDVILRNGWDGVETFIRLDYEPDDDF